MFPQLIDPECKVDVRIAEQFLENIDGLIMKGLRRELAAAEARVLAGEAGAAGDTEFLFVSIRRRLRDRDAIRREVIAWIFRVHDDARAPAAGAVSERGSQMCLGHQSGGLPMKWEFENSVKGTSPGGNSHDRQLAQTL
jgi:hypothetical protein